MRKYELLKEEHNIVRKCSRQKQVIDPETRKVVGVTPDFFRLRTEDKGYLSANWLEFNEGDRQQRIEKAFYMMKDGGLIFGAKDVLALSHVEIIKYCGMIHSTKINIKLRPTSRNKAHVGIYGLPKNNSNEDLLGLLAMKSIAEIATIPISV